MSNSYNQIFISCCEICNW